jgi:outer membrane protein
MKQLLLLVILLNLSLSKTFGLEISFNSLREFIETKNNKVAATALNAEAAIERQGFLTRSFLPKITLNAAQESFETGIYSSKTQPVYGIAASVNLYNGHRDKYENEIRNLNVEKTKTVKDQVIAEELLQARMTYWECIYLTNKVEILKTAMEINSKNAASAQKRINSGVATQTDKIEFEMEAINLERELLATDVLLTNAKNTLNFILGLEENKKLIFNEKFEHDHDYESQINFKVSDIEFLYKNIEIDSEIFDNHASKEKNAIFPKLDAYASYNQFNLRERDFLNQSDRDEFVLGIKISLDLPSGFESNRDSMSNQLQAQASKSLLDYQKKSIYNKIKNQENELKYLHDQVHFAEENIKKSEQYYKFTQSEYARGVKNSPDVLNASQMLLAAKDKRIAIVKNFLVLKSRYLTQIGK